MEKQQLTDQQRRAVETTGRDVLVAASAGTGKTTVLASRCLYLRVHEHVPLRTVLAVTFTDAAAADMRRKISSGLREHLEQHPDETLQRDVLLIDRAPISTLHAFCFKLVREHFHQLGLDPGFTIIDPDEAELLKADVADRLLEQWFARHDEAGGRFLALAEAYGGRDGQSLAHEVRRLHEFLQTLPDPTAWRERVRSSYRADGGFVGLTWHEAYTALWRRALDQCQTRAENAKQLLDRVGGMDKYQPYLAGIRAHLDDWRSTHAGTLDDRAWAAFLDTVRNTVLDKAPIVRGASDEQKSVQAHVTGLTKQICETFIDRLAAQSPSEMVKDIRAAAPLVEALLELQHEFETEYNTAKSRRWQLDFNDLERYSHELLIHRPNAAREVRRRYRHILVDEYQDINPLQDAILLALSQGDSARSASELFLVGDEKQSIYGFRLAAPRLFMEKLRQFSPDASAERVRIPLTHNFRCRREIVNGVNHIFGHLAPSGYGEEARLTYGAEYPRSPLIEEPIPIEIHLLEKDSAAEPDNNDDDADSGDRTLAGASSALEHEATMIARRVQELIAAETHVWNRDEKKYVRARYRDMVILLRTLQNRADAIATVLQSQGVPVYNDSTTGFFDAVEVRDMLALLALLDNAGQDVALAAVLRSPMVGLSDDDLAMIRARHPGGRFYDAVWSFTDQGPESRARGMLAEFRARLERWRVDATQLPLGRVVWDIYRTTCYLEYVQGLPGGEIRSANLVRLHERARQFDQFHQRGLFRFLRFLRRLQEAEHDFGTGPILSEADDVVRIMSIHKSKGLEFPIVFVPDLAKNFNLRDIGKHLLFHQDLLLGIERIDLERMQRAPTLPKLLIADEKRNEVLAEEQRLLYVALTRVRERLILSATADIERSISKWRVDGGDSAARCALDWLGPIFAKHPDTANTLDAAATPERADESYFALTRHSVADIRTWTKPQAEPVVSGLDLEALASCRIVEVTAPADVVADVNIAKSRLEWRYPYARLQNLPGKLSVTKWKDRFPVDDDEVQPFPPRAHTAIARRPTFLAGKRRLTAAERGLATHGVLQRLDLRGSLDAEALQAQVNAMIDLGVLRNDEARAVRTDTLLAFLHRPLGMRLRGAARVQRELPFSMLMPANEIPMEAMGQTWLEGTSETVLVQGKIDCLFWENGVSVLIDYKTDDLSQVASHDVDRYREQLRLYARALRAINGMEVGEIHIVFLDAMQDVRL